MHRYIFENLDKAGLFGVDAEVQNLRAVGVDIRIVSAISIQRFDLHAVEVVTSSDDERVADLVTRAGGREVDPRRGLSPLVAGDPRGRAGGNDVTPKDQVAMLLRTRSVRIAEQERYIRYLEAALKAARERIAALEAVCERT